MAIKEALEVLGHDALTMEKFALFHLMVVEQAIQNKSVCYFRGPTSINSSP